MGIHSVIGGLGDLKQQVKQVLQDDPMHWRQQEHQQLQRTLHRASSGESYKKEQIELN